MATRFFRRLPQRSRGRGRGRVERPRAGVDESERGTGARQLFFLKRSFSLALLAAIRADGSSGTPLRKVKNVQ
jgi:hypothetical protein